MAMGVYKVHGVLGMGGDGLRCVVMGLGSLKRGKSTGGVLKSMLVYFSLMTSSVG